MNYRITMAQINPFIKYVREHEGEFIGKNKGLSFCVGKCTDLNEKAYPNLLNVRFFVYYAFDDRLSHITFAWKTPIGEIREQTIYLAFKPSNLGTGQVCYFVCPLTGRLCRKLYTDGILLCSRYAFDHNYSYQNESRNSRVASKVVRNDKDARLPVKKRRQIYAGQPTRWAMKLSRMEDREREGYIMALSMGRRRKNKG